uniref:Elongation of very long chain fatty acids protein n=1 Tax=Stomoxys calcitrans TaxID=35570 RepID=A0A1I8NPT3_STOCA
MSSSSSSINLTPSINGTDDLIADLLKFFFEPDDPRVKQWFLAGSPVPLFTIVGVYLVFCLRAGPWFMRNRKPFELKNTLLIYNGLQVILSCVLFYEFYQAGWGTHYNYKCEPLVFKTDPQSLRMARAVWLFYIAKITELLDTVFFVLRKKDRQISTLHLYHHTIMPLGLYFAVQNFAAGHGTVICFVNSFVHIVMYTYYMLAALGPKIQKYLWWKKYITILQMLQFLFVFLHSLQVPLRKNCSYPLPVAAVIGFNACVFSYMFGAFYVQNYLKDNSQKVADKKD